MIGELLMLKKLGKQLDYEIILINIHEFQGLRSIEAVKKFRELVTQSFE